MVSMKIADIVDRFTICLLKHIRTNESQLDELTEYLDHFHAYALDVIDIVPYITSLLESNTKTWDLESGIRNSAIDNDVLLVGELALAVRDNNKIRVGIKNSLALKTGGYTDIKVNYVGEK